MALSFVGLMLGACSSNSGSGTTGGGGASASTGATPTSSSTSSGTGGAPECFTAADCKAPDVCHKATCAEGHVCVVSDAADGTACDDGLSCTLGDACEKGACKGGPEMECATSAACTKAVCDEKTKGCVEAPAADGTACDDGVVCTDGDACSAGKCVGGGPKSCVPSSDCVTAQCDEVSQGCVETPVADGGACDDHDPCTATSACVSGKCAGGPGCAGTECAASVCTPTGCQTTPVVGGAACGVSDCTMGQCDGLGTCNVSPVNIGGACSDGLFCTTGETCDATGTCGKGGPTCVPPPGQMCATTGCDEAAAMCTQTNVVDGAVCTDSNACTAGDTCGAGACVSGTPVLACVNGDGCCPAGCDANSDTDCLYWVSGVQQDVDPAVLSGWKSCLTTTYGDSATLADVLAACGGAKLLLACRKVGDANFKLLAMGPRVDVLHDCGSTQDCTQVSNGVGWYFSDHYSWGFAPGGDSMNRSSCDYGGSPQADPGLRMCWHTSNGAIQAGYRCGDDQNGGYAYSVDWERDIYTAD